jgi:NAD+ diphosphatase
VEGGLRGPIAFAGGAIDRAGHRRTDEAWLQDARRDPAARAIVVTRDGAVPEPQPLQPGDDDPIFLGSEPDGPLFAVRRPDAEGRNLRDLAATLPGDRIGQIAYATALVNWAGATRFCGRCGHPTEARDGGHLRVCANGHQHHPRTDPVVIMLVVDGDRALLGRQPTWPAGRYSALAGFVEPGEPLETAVAREVREEAGVEAEPVCKLGDVRYWYQRSGRRIAKQVAFFLCEYRSGDPADHDSEVEVARWMPLDEAVGALSYKGEREMVERARERLRR